jgi:hypothetical protein
MEGDNLGPAGLPEEDRFLHRTIAEMRTICGQQQGLGLTEKTCRESLHTGSFFPDNPASDYHPERTKTRDGLKNAGSAGKECVVAKTRRTKAVVISKTQQIFLSNPSCQRKQQQTGTLNNKENTLKRLNTGRLFTILKNRHLLPIIVHLYLLGITT